MKYWSLSLVLAVAFSSRQTVASTVDPESTTLSPDEPVNTRTRFTLGFGLFGRPTYMYTTVGPWYRIRIEAACRTLMTVLAIGPTSKPVNNEPESNPKPPTIIPLQDRSTNAEQSTTGNVPPATAVTRSLFSNMMDPYTGVMSYCNRVLTLSGSTGISVRV